MILVPTWVHSLTQDIFLTLRLYTLINLKTVYLALFVAGVVFLAIPLIVSWFQLVHEVGAYWWCDDVTFYSFISSAYFCA